MATERDFNGADTRIQNVFQGDCKVSTDPRAVFSTVLGSCISACIYDPQNKVGGMNHFLLPAGQDGDSASMRYGAHSMEVLLNELFKLGANRRNLQVKLAGGAQVTANNTDIGSRNEQFVRDFLRQEGYPVVSASLGGMTARRVLFRPSTGEARVKIVQMDAVRETTKVPIAAPKSEISLF